MLRNPADKERQSTPTRQKKERKEKRERKNVTTKHISMNNVSQCWFAHKLKKNISKQDMCQQHAQRQQTQGNHDMTTETNTKSQGETSNDNTIT